MDLFLRQLQKHLYKSQNLLYTKGEIHKNI